MKERNKKQEARQRRSLQIEKFEHRMVPAASIIPVDVIQVDVLEEPISTPVHSAIEATEQVKQQGALVNQLREGKGPPGVWTNGNATSVVEKLAPAVDGLWHDAIPEEDFGPRMADLANGITFPDDLGPPGVWTNGNATSVVEKLAPAVDGLWHDAIPEEDFALRIADLANEITFPDDLGPPGIWGTGPVSSVVEASVVDQAGPRASSTWIPCPPYEPLATEVDRIFHDAGEPDIPISSSQGWQEVVKCW
ncbi:MAG: hypothetical protein VB877_11345 [Pirellulaceae bacterium]